MSSIAFFFRTAKLERFNIYSACNDFSFQLPQVTRLSYLLLGFISNQY